MKNFESIRIMTNGVKFRILVGLKNPANVDKPHEVYLPKDGTYYGNEACGYQPIGPTLEFFTRQEAIDYIKKEYGESAIRLLQAFWFQC